MCHSVNTKPVPVFKHSNLSQNALCLSHTIHVCLLCLCNNSKHPTVTPVMYNALSPSPYNRLAIQPLTMC